MILALVLALAYITFGALALHRLRRHARPGTRAWALIIAIALLPGCFFRAGRPPEHGGGRRDERHEHDNRDHGRDDHHDHHDHH